MEYYEKTVGIDQRFIGQWLNQPAPPAGLLEERILELEQMGLTDLVDFQGEISPVRQFALASLLHVKPPYFVTYDDELLAFRDELELKYGMMIYSIPEAIMLFREIDGPPN